MRSCRKHVKFPWDPSKKHGYTASALLSSRQNCIIRAVPSFVTVHLEILGFPMGGVY